MALFPAGMARYSFTYDNWGANPSATYGTLLTAGGAINTEGSAAVLATGSNIAQDVYWVELHVHTASGAGDRSMLIDIGVDPAGGTSYTYVISNIAVGGTSAISGTAQYRFLFPLYIKAGSQVAARVQCIQASITVRVAAKFFGQPNRPEMVPSGAYSETIGTVTNSLGQSFTPGNSADGSWVSLGTTVLPLWWWQLCHGINNATVTAENTYIDLAYGDGTNKHIIHRVMHNGTTAELMGHAGGGSLTSAISSFCPVPAGSTIYVRGRCNGAPDTGYYALAIGVGG
jgi:hypothetical protein